MQSFVILLSTVCFIGLISGAVVDTVVEEQKSKGEEVPAVDVNIDEDCHQPRESGRCFALFYRYAFNVEKRQCEEFIYGGCAGNKNNFESLEDCEAKCTKKASEEPTEEPKIDSSSTESHNKSEVSKPADESV